MSTDKLLNEIAQQPAIEEVGNPNYNSIEVKRRTLANNDYEQDIMLRKCFAWSIFAFVATFVLIVLILVYLCACNSSNFSLSDTVLIALLTTMTSSIVGLLIFVVKYLFSKNNYSE